MNVLLCMIVRQDRNISYDNTIMAGSDFNGLMVFIYLMCYILFYILCYAGYVIKNVNIYCSFLICLKFFVMVNSSVLHIQYDGVDIDKK